MCEEITLINYHDKLWAFNNNTLSSNQIVLLFSYLISSGEIFNLPKKHRDTAKSFVSYGLLSASGEISWKKYRQLFGKV